MPYIRKPSIFTKRVRGVLNDIKGNRFTVEKRALFSNTAISKINLLIMQLAVSLCYFTQ